MWETDQDEPDSTAQRQLELAEQMTAIEPKISVTVAIQEKLLPDLLRDPLEPQHHSP